MIIAVKNQNGKFEIIQSVKPNQECAIVLDKTNFYPESGGQTYDRGMLMNLSESNLKFEITNVVHVQGYSFHEGKVISRKNLDNEAFEPGNFVECSIDKKFRYNASSNHTGLINFCKNFILRV